MAADRSGDAGADPLHGEGLEVLFTALEGPLLCYAMRLVKDTESAEDIVQEAFLKLHEQGSDVREPRGWLYRTIHNLALNRLRASERMVPLVAGPQLGTEDEDELVDVQPLPDEQLARLEAIGLVRLGLDGLDARSREVVRMKFHDGLSYREISERTGLTEGHVGYLLHYALKSLAADLAKAGLLS